MNFLRTDFRYLRKLASAALIAGLLSACGMQRGGQYDGLEAAISNGTTVSTNQLLLTIQETGGDRVSGTWTTMSGTFRTSSGNFTGVLSGNEIQRVVLRKSESLTDGQNSSNFLTSTISYLSTSGVCIGQYQGKLRFEGNSIIGSLEPSQNLQNQMTGGLGTCSRIDVEVTKLN